MQTPEDSTETDEKDSTIAKTDHFNLPAGKNGNVKTEADPRLEKMSEFMGSPVGSEGTVKLKGFRVQLYFSTDKDEVNQKRADFLGQYHEYSVYVDWLPPNHRLRAGDFRTRLQAQALQDRVRELFPDAVVVEDLIELPKLDH